MEPLPQLQAEQCRGSEGGGQYRSRNDPDGRSHAQDGPQSTTDGRTRLFQEAERYQRIRDRWERVRAVRGRHSF